MNSVLPRRLLWVCIHHGCKNIETATSHVWGRSISSACSPRISDGTWYFFSVLFGRRPSLCLPLPCRRAARLVCARGRPLLDVRTDGWEARKQQQHVVLGQIARWKGQGSGWLASELDWYVVHHSTVHSLAPVVRSNASGGKDLGVSGYWYSFKCRVWCLKTCQKNCRGWKMD